MSVNVNDQYAGVEYHYVYLVICAFLVWLIIPGIGLLYGGLARRKSSLSLLFQSIMVVAVTTFQWMFWGYTLAYSRTASAFIGDMANFGMKNVSVAPSPGNANIPEIVFCLYQLLFCACTVQIVIGGSFERGRILPSLVFAFFWECEDCIENAGGRTLRRPRPDGFVGDGAAIEGRFRRW